MCSPIPSMLVRSTPAIRCNWVAKGLSFLLLGRLQGIDLRLGLGLELAGRQFRQGLGNLLIAMANLLLVKFVSVQRRLQSKKQLWSPVTFQAFGDGFLAGYNPPTNVISCGCAPITGLKMSISIACLPQPRK